MATSSLQYPRRFVRSVHITLSLCSAVLDALSVVGTPTTRIIDDEYGDLITGAQIVYSDGWSYGPKCSMCDQHPDSSKTKNGTWHNGSLNSLSTEQRYFVVNFTGTAVSVYGALPNEPKSYNSLVNLTFTLDAILLDPFFTYAFSDDKTPFKYDVSVFQKAGLDNKSHSLRVDLVTDPSAKLRTAFLFDYIEYTSDVPPNPSISAPTGLDSSASASTGSVMPTASQHAPIAPILGGVVAVVVIFLAGLGLFLVARHRRHRARILTEKEVVPQWSPEQVPGAVHLGSSIIASHSAMGAVPAAHEQSATQQSHSIADMTHVDTISSYERERALMQAQFPHNPMSVVSASATPLQAQSLDVTTYPTPAPPAYNDVGSRSRKR